MLNRIASSAVRSNVRSLAAAVSSARSVHSLPPLPYEYDALEPTISAEIMEIHHSRHHAAYVAGLNAAEAKYAAAVANGDIGAAIKEQPGIKFNGGGHLNHSLFWDNLAPAGQGGGGMPEGELLEAIESRYGSFDEFKTSFSAITAAVQGSGWGWLGYDKVTDTMRITTCANQDPLEATTGLVPLLGIDIWEHAYYLQYQNVRPNYLGAIWDVVNWGEVSKRYEDAKIR